jgi:osmoprotectant transport system permease protein
MELLTDVVAWFGQPDRWSLTSGRGVPYRAFQHVWFTLVSMAIAVAVATPPALLLAHRRKAEAVASAVVNIGRAIPSFGLIVLFWLFAVLTGWVGTAFWPLVGALVLLALPPIFTNTYTAVREVDPATVEAARGMGYRERQILTQVELPLATPVMLAGIRIATVQVIATVAIGAIVTNGGGFGRFIVDGFARASAGHPEVIAGALLVAALTLLSEALFSIGQRVLVPEGVRGSADLADVANQAGAAG